MNEAIDVILSCDDDPSLQEYYRQKEMAEIEEGILLAKARAEGRADTIRLMYAGGMTLQGIASLLKTSLDEIKEILRL